MGIFRLTKLAFAGASVFLALSVSAEERDGCQHYAEGKFSELYLAARTAFESLLKPGIYVSNFGVMRVETSNAETYPFFQIGLEHTNPFGGRSYLFVIFRGGNSPGFYAVTQSEFVQNIELGRIERPVKFETAPNSVSFRTRRRGLEAVAVTINKINDQTVEVEWTRNRITFRNSFALQR